MSEVKKTNPKLIHIRPQPDVYKRIAEVAKIESRSVPNAACVLIQRGLNANHHDTFDETA